MQPGKGLNDENNNKNNANYNNNENNRTVDVVSGKIQHDNIVY